MTLMPLILAALATSQAADGQAALKVGAVNLQECFDSDKCEIAKEVNAELKARFGERQKKLADLKKRGQDLKNELDALPPDAHALREEKEKKLAFLITEIKYEEETGKKKYLEYYKNRKVEIYGKITDAVNKVAADMKLDFGIPLTRESEDERESVTFDIGALF